MMNKLTIAIPVYNGAKTISRTLDGIVSQLCEGVNILISDNASTDDTQQIVAEYQKKYPQISYVKNVTNVGYDCNCDLAIRAATGEYVWLFSDDDFMMPGAIKEVFQVLLQNDKIGYVFVNWRVCKNGIYKKPIVKIKEDIFTKDGYSFITKIKLRPLLMSSNIIKKEWWVSAYKESFLHSNWIHYLILLSLLDRDAFYAIATPCVAYNYQITGWKKDYYFRIRNGLTLVEWIMKLVSNKKVMRILVKVNTREIPGLLRRCRKNRTIISLSDIKKMIRYFYFQPSFWVRCFPEILISILLGYISKD